MTLYNICYATIHNLAECDLSEAQFNALTADGFSSRLHETTFLCTKITLNVDICHYCPISDVFIDIDIV